MQASFNNILRDACFCYYDIFVNFASMKRNRKLSLSVSVAVLSMASAMFSACSSSPKSNDIIAKKPEKVVKKSTQKVGDYAQTRKVQWLGAEYTVSVERKADTSLPLVADEQGNKYYDNRITLIIKRPDGTEFFHRTFSKNDFTAYVGDDENNGALLGVVFDRAEGANLYFAASVGSPDNMSDEYVPLVLRIERSGNVVISKDTQLDTSGDMDSEDELSEEDGV